jgi:hypothetical protein
MNFKDQQEYVSKVAKKEADACALIEAGFEYVCDFNEARIFRKRKYHAHHPWTNSLAFST